MRMNGLDGPPSVLCLVRVEMLISILTLPLSFKVTSSVASGLALARAFSPAWDCLGTERW